MPQIRTKRLLLRRATMDDVAGMHAIFTDARAMRFWSRPPHETLAESERWVSEMVQFGPDSDDYIIEWDGKVIGKAGAWRLPEIGYILHPDHWGKGFASEALTALIPHLFASHPIPELTAEVDPRNLASIRLLERFGFLKTRYEENTLQWGDEWCDSQYFALPRDLADTSLKSVPAT